jgi:F-type H+-transporting ATPase subunit a
MSAALLPMADIQIGHHPTRDFLGLTFNIDTIWTMAIAGAVVLGLGFWARRQLARNAGNHVPTKLQLIFELVVNEVQTQVEDTLGYVNRTVVMIAVAEFFFILTCNWLEMIPSEPNRNYHFLPSPTADVNLVYAMAIMVMVGVWGYGIRQRGLGGYLKHFAGVSVFPEKPILNFFARIIFTFLNIIEEVTKPISLPLRLFGNIFAGGILIALIASLTAWSVGVIPIGGVLSVLFAIIWKIFDMAIGGIQAFIFALLTVLYFGMAAGGHDDHASEETTDEASRTPTHHEEEPELAA